MKLAGPTSQILERDGKAVRENVEMRGQSLTLSDFVEGTFHTDRDKLFL